MYLVAAHLLPASGTDPSPQKARLRMTTTLIIASDPRPSTPDSPAYNIFMGIFIGKLPICSGEFNPAQVIS
jgi:hypothetical protein